MFHVLRTTDSIDIRLLAPESIANHVKHSTVRRRLEPILLLLSSSRTDPDDDDVVDVTSFSALDVVEIKYTIVAIVVIVVGARRS